TQLEDVVNLLSDQQYNSPILLLSNATIGQHVRHIIEFYIELDKGYESGEINYDNRKREHSIETCRITAVNNLRLVTKALAKENKTLAIYADYSLKNETPGPLPTNYFRELMYNLEHTVHHMALIRVGLLTSTKLSLPNDFGVASSTLKFREQQCAQ
ncbi:MAG: DinB family protein, partial [Bacteroidia bacterium]